MPETRVHAAATVALALALCREVRPTLVATELRLHDGDGFAFLRALTQELAGCPRLLALTGRSDEVALHRAQEGRLSGLIWKTPAAAAQLRAALPVVLAGGVCFPPEVRDLMREVRAAPEVWFKILSPTEQELLPLLGQGMTNGEIALRSGRNPETVKWHRKAIMRKLGIHRAPDLAGWCMAKGFVPGSQSAPPCLFSE